MLIRESDDADFTAILAIINDAALADGDDKDRLLRTYRSIPPRQIETPVVVTRVGA